MVFKQASEENIDNVTEKVHNEAIEALNGKYTNRKKGEYLTVEDLACTDIPSWENLAKTLSDELNCDIDEVDPADVDTIQDRLDNTVLADVNDPYVQN